jgi:hypothetical protein
MKMHYDQKTDALYLRLDDSKIKEGELDESSVIRNFRITAADGKSYDTQFYNLDVIISVGYRVRELSPRATVSKMETVRREGMWENGG